ncbi:hypothetical protein H9P43_001157 [Blastocladiella emersonii ATCC 22665]|nr:hypothetical protein H9P43_001157 [Blastocladiella emersonii ATCC 22665]
MNNMNGVPQLNQQYEMTAYLRDRFNAVDVNRDGKISADELQQALALLGYTTFNPECVRLMISLHDFDQSGTIDLNEFLSLWRYVTDWHRLFAGFDQDGSGTIDCSELHQALIRFGFNLTPELIQLLVRKYDRYGTNTMTFDSFIQCCVTLQGLTRSFRQFDTTGTGVIQISYHDFLKLVMTQNL